jgi:putative colanic acid biosynthesis UDP-glucose lipid carrier transferase
MFDDRIAAARFLSAPLSTSAAFSALLEPVLAAALLWFMHLVFGEPVEGDSIALLLLVTAMLYPGVNRLGRTGVGVGIDILLNWVPLLAVLALIGYATRPYHDLPVDMLLVWAGVTPLALWICTRAATAVLNERLARPEAQRRAVVVGAGQMGLRVKEVIASRKKSGWRMLGMFDDRAPERLNLDPGPEFLGKLADLPAFIDAHGVHDVFITLPLSSQPRILALMEALENSTTWVHYVPDLFGVSIIQGRLEDMGGLPVVSLMLTPFTGVNRLLKRASDIALAGAILLLVAPIMLAVAVGVRLSSPGPVIFKQRRTGLDGEAIWVYKFRSMTTQDDGAVVKQATRDDPRVTPFGRFIRRTSLDELPQFVNVLQGRMSIVGPRPHALAHNEQYRQLVRAYMARHKVKPGITGWAQVHGYRGETDTLEKMARRVEYDLEYLRNWSLGLDLLIIARTVKIVIRGRNAH